MDIRGLRCILITVTMATVAVAGSAATPDGVDLGELFPGAVYDSTLPSPEAFFGFEPGARPLHHGEILAYLEALAEASPRMRILDYATSHEGRRLVAVAIGEPGVISGLEAFREEHARLADPRGRSPEEEAALLSGARAVAWLAYGIHGDELSSPDAAVAVIYRLVAGEDETARMLRRELLVLVDPCENPDGRERYLAQTASFAHKVPNPDTDDLSHTAVWPWGRGNHYLFDLNRDWFTMVQPESRRSVMIASWAPQLVVDSHEMGAHDTYLFSPARHPFNPWKSPKLRPWAGRFSADQARALDRWGFPYYRAEWNEEFFPGYGSSWGSYLGAVGILYEMARTAGTVVQQEGGTLRTFAQAVEHQATSSLANLATLAANREAVLRTWIGIRREAAQGGRGVAAWVLPARRYPDRVRRLVEILRKQGIEVERLEAPVAVRGLVDAVSGAPEDTELPAGAWRVRTDQPAGFLVRALMDPHVPMSDEFLREEREYQEKGKGSRLYEVTAWSLPLAFGIEAMWSATPLPGEWRPAGPEEPTGGVEEAEASFGWILDGTPDRAVFAAADLLAGDVVVRLADREFTVEGCSFPAGSLLVRREGNLPEVETLLAQVAHRRHVEFVGVSTSASESGPDLGGRHFVTLVEPRVAVVTGMPVSPSDYGAVWHLFDEAMGLRFSAIEAGRLPRVDLRRYNVLILPPSFGGVKACRAALGAGTMKRLRRWVEEGGTLIAMGSGAEMLADEGAKMCGVKLRRQALDRFPPVVFGPSAIEVDRAGRFRGAGLRVPGKSGGRKAGPSGGDPLAVSPVIGPGAEAFAAPGQGGELGKPVVLADWVRPLLAPGLKKVPEEDLERADARLRRFRPRGAFLLAELDTDTFLTWGLGEELPVLVNAPFALVTDVPGVTVVRLASPERMHLGGLLWPEAAGRWSGTAWLTRESVGRGQVLLFLENPAFRGVTLGARRLLVNAVVYGPGAGTRWSRPW